MMRYRNLTSVSVLAVAWFVAVYTGCSCSDDVKGDANDWNVAENDVEVGNEIDAEDVRPVDANDASASDVSSDSEEVAYWDPCELR